MARRTKKPPPEPLQVLMVPCSCGTTFSVAKGDNREGVSWSRFLVCPKCGKRHDPRNRLLHLGYQQERFWKVEEC